MSTKSMAVIGCGNIGSRLLQSAAAADVDALSVYGVEPFAAARELSAERFAQIGGDHELHMVESAAELPESVDLLVVACSAHQRMDALTAALERTTPAAVLLEKVLFTKDSDYDRAAGMLDGIPTWVNTTRDIWPGYVALRPTLTDDPLHLTISGSDWGLGSNGIHFLALVEMLSGSPVTDITVEDAQARDAKRDGYRELTATLRAALSDGSTATLVSSREDGHPVTLRLEQGGASYSIDEGKGTINGEPFGTLYTSQLGFALTEMLDDRSSGLPSLSDSSRLHRLYLDALRPHIHPQAPDGDLCMVT